MGMGMGWEYSVAMGMLPSLVGAPRAIYVVERDTLTFSGIPFAGRGLLHTGQSGSNIK